MASPCPRCGTTKTESVRHGFIYNTPWNMGYHLRRCSFCNRWRLFKRLDRHRPHPDDMTVEELQENFNRKIAESLGKTDEASKANGGNMASNSPEESTGLGRGQVDHRPVWRKRLTRIETTAFAQSAGAQFIAAPAADGMNGW